MYTTELYGKNVNFIQLEVHVLFVFFLCVFPSIRNFSHAINVCYSNL